jgi:hypothetical protein
VKKILTHVLFLLIVFADIDQASAQIDTLGLSEKVTITTNGTFFIPGEELEVSVKVFLHNQTFHLSKIVYLELVDQDGNPVIQEKVNLINGCGSASLYLPSYLRSGNYSLIYYTKWSTNYNIPVNQRLISIINPFNPLPGSLFLEKYRFDSLQITLYPEGGNYYLDSTQKVAFRIHDENGNPAIGNVTVTNTSGLSIYKEQSVKQGLFQINTISDREFTITLSDTLDRVFFKRIELSSLFPQPVNIFESSEKYQVTSLVNDVTGKVLIYANHLPIKKVEYSSHNTQKLTFSKADLPKGLLSFQYLEKDQIIYYRHFFNEPDRLDIDVSIADNQLKTRQKTSLKLNTALDANVTISIRKKYDIENGGSLVTDYYIGTISDPHRKSWPKSAFDDRLLQEYPKKKNSFFELDRHPDYRGELITGHIGKSSENPNILLTTKGQSYQIYPISPAPNGSFQVSLKSNTDYQQMYFSNIGNTTLTMDDQFFSNYDFLTIPKLMVKQSDIEGWLIEKSIEVQLKNLYDTYTQHDIVTKGLFDGWDKQIFVLDEYTRFPTLSDPILEYIPILEIRKEGNERTFYIRNMENRTSDQYGVFSSLNGIPCSPDYILKLDQSIIERIEVVTKQFILGKEVYAGAVNFITFPDVSSSETLMEQARAFNVQGPLKDSKNPSEKYQHRNNPEFEQPGMEVQLLWEPHLTLKKDQSLSIPFRASAIPGSYEAIVTGFAGDQYIYESVEFTISQE